MSILGASSIRSTLTHPALFGSLLAAGAIVAACQGANTLDPVCEPGEPCDAPAAISLERNPETIAYLADTWGIRITGYEDWEQYEQDDGSVYGGGTATITVEGLGAQEVMTDTLIISDEFGTNTSFFVALPDGSEERYFLYDRENNYVTIGDAVGERSVIVSSNADGTYDVDLAIGEDWQSEGTGLTGAEALEIVKTHNEYTSITPHILLMAFAAAHTPSSLEVRLPIICTDTSATPEVCTIFREFCDCIACDVLDRPGVCDACTAD